jgi:hypothetical protein
MARLATTKDAMASFDIEGHQWSSGKIDAAVRMEDLGKETANATTQIDISQTLTDIATDALTRFSTEEAKQSKRQIQETLKPTTPQKSERLKKRDQVSPVKAFDSPISRMDYESYLDATREMGLNKAEPFPLDQGKGPRLNRDKQGPPVAPMLDMNHLRNLNDAGEVQTAVDEFSLEMGRFAQSVADSIKTLTRRLNSLSRSLEAEGHDIR